MIDKRFNSATIKPEHYLGEISVVGGDAVALFKVITSNLLSDRWQLAVMNMHRDRGKNTHTAHSTHLTESKNEKLRDLNTYTIIEVKQAPVCCLFSLALMTLTQKKKTQ